MYVDDAVSGTESSRRKAFQQLMSDAHSPVRSFEVVLVYDVKRFGRLDNDEAGHHRWLLRKRGIRIIYVAEGFAGNSTDDLLRPVKQWQAREESKDLSRVTIRGLLSRIQRDRMGGFWMGGFPPHGYDLRYQTQEGKFRFVVRYMRDGSKLLLDECGSIMETVQRGQPYMVLKSDRCRLVPSAVERVELIQRLFTLVTKDGLPIERIARTLRREGVPTSRGPAWSAQCSGVWSFTAVRNMLVNPVYCGDMVWNRRTLARFFKIGTNGAEERLDADLRRTMVNPQEVWVLTRDTHEGLVTRDLWLEAQRLIAERTRSPAPAGARPR